MNFLRRRKRCNVGAGEVEPLSISPSVGEALVPVPFNANGIVGLDGVHEFESLGSWMVSPYIRRPIAAVRPIL